MNGRTQTSEAKAIGISNFEGKFGSLTYYAIGMENPVVEVDDDMTTVTYTSALTANAYGAQGTFRMKGTHYYRRIDGEWIAVNQPE